MRGFWGMVLELVPGAIALALLTAVVMAWWRARRTQPKPQVVRKDKLSIGGTATLVFVALWILMGASYGYHVLRFHYELWRLQSDEVVSMQIGHQRFLDRAAIADVVNDLKASEWYSVSHGGWGDEVPLVLNMRAGETWRMRVGYHFTQQGAVVQRLNIDPGTKHRMIVTWGYVFSDRLPNTFQRIGIPLPLCDTAHGRPCSPTSAH